MREPREPRLTRPAASGREPSFGRPASPGREEPDLFDLFPGRDAHGSGQDGTDPFRDDLFADPMGHGGEPSLPDPFGRPDGGRSATGQTAAGHGGGFSPGPHSRSQSGYGQGGYAQDGYGRPAAQRPAQPDPYGDPYGYALGEPANGPVSEPGMAGQITGEPNFYDQGQDPEWDPPPLHDFSGGATPAGRAGRNGPPVDRSEPMMGGAVSDGGRGGRRTRPQENGDAFGREPRSDGPRLRPVEMRAAAATRRDRGDRERTDRMAVQAEVPVTPRRKKGLLLVAVAAGVVMVGGAGWLLLSGGGGADGKLPAPTIVADQTPYKVRPADPGGMQVANQDKMVYERISPEEMQQPGVEKLLPDPVAPKAPELAESVRQGQAVVPTAPSTPPSLAPEVRAVAPAPAPVPAPVQAPPQPAAPPPVMTMPAAPSSSAPSAPTFTAPAPTQGQPPVPATAATAPKAPPVPAKPAATGTYSVQLAALRDEVSVRKQWDGLQAKYPALLGSLSMGIERADLGNKGVFYRLRATGLPSEEAARTLCSELAKQKVGCLFVGK